MYKIALSHGVIQCYKAFQMYLRTRKRTVEGSNGFELMLLHGSSRCCLAHSESCRHRDPHVTKVERKCAAWPAIINLLTFCCVLKSKISPEFVVLQSFCQKVSASENSLFQETIMNRSGFTMIHLPTKEPKIWPNFDLVVAISTLQLVQDAGKYMEV